MCLLCQAISTDRTEGTVKMSSKGFAFKSKATGDVKTGVW
jgi:hypothetical protein